MKSNNNKFYIALGVILILALLIVRSELGNVLDSGNSQNNQIVNSNSSFDLKAHSIDLFILFATSLFFN